MQNRRPLILAALVAPALLVLGIAGGSARADIMTACVPEIDSYCADVAEGRGRIAACLVANTEKLSPGCAPEVKALAQRTSSNRLVPSGVRNMLVSQRAMALPATCTADAQQLCPGVPTGDSRVFACLYSRMSRVSEACSSAAEKEMNQ